ncbi:DMT family transporter [uncultured Reyranella sp.]|uniref:DMT family transporter n=1 Tax=uncultured Reyranella sp. TaxID=735512 RepID=UPI0025EE0E67|nr:DMT family transporter [uncultured Reyranella sp.]
MSGAAILALGAAFCFALALILTQFGLRTMPSWRSPLYSIGGALVVAWLAAILFVDWSTFNLDAALIFAGVGCIFPVVVSILAVRSNERLGPAVAGAVGNVTPIFAVLGAVLFLGEHLGFVQLAGLAMVVGGVALLALRGGTGGRHWSVWVLGLPLAAALVRGAIQPAIKTGLGLWHEPLAAAAIGYALSSVVIVSLVGRRALREGPAIRSGVLWFLAVGFANGSATFLLYAALGLGSITVVAPLVALFPLMGVVMSWIFLRGEQLHAIGLLGIVVSVAGVILLLLGGT